MKNKEKFEKWLVQKSTLKDSSITKYSGAINTISKELVKEKIIEKNLYYILSPIELKRHMEAYFNLDKYQLKDKKGNRMYSRAFKYYIDYISDQLHEYDEYKESQEKLMIIENNGKYDAPEIKPNYTEINHQKIWVRKSYLVQETLQINNYECEIDKSHKYFINKSTGKNDVEVHHFIPMKFQERFAYSIDVLSNMVCLCVVCHKLFHHGLLEDRVKLIEKLYDKKKDRLKSSNILITKQELIDLYRHF